jgi:hypothetical protein
METNQFRDIKAIIVRRKGIAIEQIYQQAFLERDSSVLPFL